MNTTFFFKTSGGNSSRINIHWWTASPGREGADYFGTEMSLFERWKDLRPSAYVTRPDSEPELLQADHSAELPPSLRNVEGHGGSHPSSFTSSSRHVWSSAPQRSMSIRPCPTRRPES